jgi:hypothetical protein
MSLEQAVAAAGVDPYALQETLASGDPGGIYDLANAFEDAGTEAGTAYRKAAAAHGQVGGSFTNNAAAVLDVDGQNQEAWQALGKGGQDMTSTATLLRRAGTALETAVAGGAAALRRMEEGFGALQQSWNTHVQRNQGVVTPADQQQFVASAKQIVQTGAAQVQEHVDAYDAVLNNGVGELAQLGYAAEDEPKPYGPFVPRSGKYRFGDPTRPPIKFDDDFVYDPDAEASFDDYVSWNKWGMIDNGARVLRPGLDDASEFYSHYRDATGTPRTVDYEEAYREDEVIRGSVDQEINDAVRAADELHKQTGSTSFSITGDAAKAEYPVTENWRKALGGHTIWGSGDVRIDGNTATMEVTVHAEDRYNFDRGKSDIDSGTPDSVNGRFAELGWAKSFDVSGTLTRTVTWELGSGQPPVIEGGGDVDRDPAGEDRADGSRSGR